MSHKALTVLIVLAAVPVAALVVIPGLSGRPSHGPRTIEEAMEVACAHGLYWATDDPSGIPTNGVVVSEVPLTREAVSKLRVNDPRHCGWIGTLTIRNNWEKCMPNYDPECSGVWGELFVYGDARLIRKLTGAVD
jgi:hypothetical protein